MANALFDAYRNAVVQGSGLNDLATSTVKAMFVDHADDTPSTSSDDFINDIASAARVPAIGSCPALTSKTFGTVGVGVLDAADATFTALSGDQAESLILFVDTGSEATSRLLAYWDTATGLPILPNGGDVIVQWSASGIYRF
jgi:hypothetical protein